VWQEGGKREDLDWKRPSMDLGIVGSLDIWSFGPLVLGGCARAI
jgi:hypothetical protein